MSKQKSNGRGQRRKKLLVDVAVQGHLVKHVLLQWMGFLVATAFILVSVEMVIGNPSGDLSHVWRQHFPIVLAITMLAPLFIMELLRFSHRFVGPIVRLRREMNDLANGKFNPPISFRENDYWKELTDDFNRIADKLRSGSQAELENLHEVKELSQRSEQWWHATQDDLAGDHDGDVAVVAGSDSHGS